MSSLWEVRLQHARAALGGHNRLGPGQHPGKQRGERKYYKALYEQEKFGRHHDTGSWPPRQRTEVG